MGHVKGGFEWMKQHYGVPARRGGRVIFDGKPGRITSTNAAGHLVLHLDGDPPRRRVYVHPRWRMEYLDEAV
jgi:hypothetical protein